MLKLHSVKVRNQYVIQKKLCTLPMVNNKKLLIFSQKYKHLGKCASLNPARIWRRTSLPDEKRRLTPALKRIRVLNSTNKVVMRWQENDFAVAVFSNGPSKKLVTSFDTFVLLEQLASLSDEWSILKKLWCFLFKRN